MNREPPVAVIVEEDHDNGDNDGNNIDEHVALESLSSSFDDETDYTQQQLQQQQRQHQQLLQQHHQHILVDDDNIISHTAATRADEISSGLYDKVVMGMTTCSNVLSGWTNQDRCCSRVVEHCVENPKQAFYANPRTGRLPLHEACLRNSCPHITKALIRANPLGALERDHSGNYPLHLLFVDYYHHNDFIGGTTNSVEEVNEVMSQILEVDPHHLPVTVNGEGSTPLHTLCAAPEIYPAIVSHLLAANAVCATTLNNHLETPLNTYCKQRHAAPNVAQLLMDSYPEAIRQVCSEGSTPLHDACRNLNQDLVCFLAGRAPPDVLRLHSRSRLMTPLHLLCESQVGDRLRALQALLEAAPDVVAIPDGRQQQTPVHVACQITRPSLEVIQRLLQANPNAVCMTDAEEYTPLHHACENGAPTEIVAYLLSVDRTTASKATRKQDTPLHLACASNVSADTVRLLLQVYPEALRKTNDYGFAPLHCVCRAYQPRMGIVQALLEASPSCVTLRTHGGETPIHLACSSGAFVGVLQLLTHAQNQLNREAAAAVAAAAANTDNELQQLSNDTGDVHLLDIMTPSTTINKVGNTPLHEACFRGASLEHIETLATATPEWIVVRNNAGYTPLQVMCKGGLLDEKVVSVFGKIQGQQVFTVMDTTGHTPLHSACREGTSGVAIRALIRAFPEALFTKTTYGDTPLHLACFRRADASVVEAIAEATAEQGRPLALLMPNTAGQTPMSIAMEEFQNVCQEQKGSCCNNNNNNVHQNRAFNVLACLVKLLYYGGDKNHQAASLVMACVCLHRKDVRLDPAFIRRVIHLYPNQVRWMDEEGNYPLHIEASIPVEKMALLDGPAVRKGCGRCHAREGVLGTLLKAFPEATQVRNHADEFPLGLMIQNGRLWDPIFSLVLRNFPPALHWYKGMMDDQQFVPLILHKTSKECGVDTLYELINNRPEMIQRH